MTERPQPNDKSLDPFFVPFAQRYTAAWAEISQRIAARQLVYLHFATVSMTAIVAVIGAWAKGGDVFRRVAECGAVGLIVYSLAFALWIRNNHAMVGLLGVYCKALEGGFREGGTPNKGDTNTEFAWHTEEQGWIVLSRHYGRLSDWAATMLAAVSSLPALYFGVLRCVCRDWLPGLVLVLAFLVGVVVAVFVGLNGKRRSEIGCYKPGDVLREANTLRRGP
jgi:hypothetical protein